MRRVARFVLVGITNSLGSLALLVLLSRFVDLRLAYAVAYVAGLGYTTVLSSRFVFRSSLDGQRALRFVGGYLCTFSLGLLLATYLERRTALASSVSSVLIVAATAPLNYLTGRIVFGDARAEG